MTYDVPNATDIWNQTGYIDLITNINTGSANIFSIGILISIFVIGIVLFTGFTRNARILNSLAITLLSAIFLSFASIVPWNYVFVLTSITVLFWLFDFFTTE